MSLDIVNKSNKASKALWVTGILFLIALGIELLFYKSFSVGYLISPDGLTYSNIAENFLHGKGLVNTMNAAEGKNGIPQAVAFTREYVVGPVYPLLLALVYGMFGLKSYGMVVLVLHTLLGAAGAVFAYKTGEILFGKRYAWIPYVLTITYPPFAFWRMYVLTETTYVFMITVVLYFMARCSQEVERPKLRTLVMFGMVIGISNLVRPLLLLFFPVLGLWLWWINRWRLKKALRDFTVILMMTVVVMSPWWIRNGIRYHQFIAVSNYGAYEFYLGNNPLTVTDSYFYFTQPSYDPVEKARIEKLPVLEQEKEYKQLAVSYILQHPIKFLERTFAKERNLFWQPSVYIEGPFNKMQGDAQDRWYLILGLAGIILSLPRLRKYSFLILFIAYYSFIVSMITVVPRYRLPVMPAMVLMASLVFVMAIEGIVRLTRLNRGTGRRKARRIARRV